MLWQDGLALLMVVGAVFGLLRAYAPAGWFRCGAGRSKDRSGQYAESTRECGGCALGASCAKAQGKLQVRHHPSDFS
ncbi:MAG: hypothetical protein KDI50_04615 [Candidatus Competibacteraceae bacterium]|nr:hypothetical protein [Candidatus Competibacteraceae bacterium]